MKKNKTEYIVGNLAEKVNGRYNIVCANIVADIIIELTANIANYFEEGAVYITSGIIDIRVDEVRSAFDKAGLTVLDEYKKENWYAFALTK